MADSKQEFRSGLLAAAVIAATGLVSADSAHAGAIASAIVDVQSVRLVDANGDPLTAGFTVNTERVTQTNRFVALDGATAGSAVFSSGPLPAGLDQTQVCLGTGCFPWGENDYSSFDSPPPDGLFSYADNIITGSIFTAAGLRDATRADVSIDDGDHTGSAHSQAGASIEIEITTGGSDITANWQLATFDRIFAYLADAFAGADAFADGSWNASIVNAMTDELVLDFDAAIPSRSANPPNQTSIFEFDTADHCNETNAGMGTDAGFVYDAGRDLCYLESTSFMLLADQTYTITIGHTTDANAAFVTQQVPEPMTLALLGSGLLGLGIVRRRSKKS